MAKRSDLRIIGLRAIADYLGYSSTVSPIAMMRRYGLPLYRRPAARHSHRMVWVLDIELYRRWQLEQARQTREQTAHLYPRLYRWSRSSRHSPPQLDTPTRTPARRSERAEPATVSAAIEPTGASSSSQLEADPADRPEIDPTSR